MPKVQSFEKQLSDLENIAGQMEQGQMPLATALKTFEDGLKLARACQTSLLQAQQRVETLVEEDGALFSQPFGEGDDKNDEDNDEDEFDIEVVEDDEDDDD